MRTLEEYMIPVEQYKAPAILDRSGRYRQPEGRGPKGRPLCRWCHREVPKRKRAWCSQECVDSYLIATGRDWERTRARVFHRDRGFCVKCGCDLNKIKRIIGWARRSSYDLDSPMCSKYLLDVEFEAMGFTDTCRSLWEADHVKARKDGGTDFPDNLRTLCVPCHKARTAIQHRTWASDRRDAEATLFAETAPQEATS